MSVSNYQELAEHCGHSVEVAIYGPAANAAVECVDCGEVLLDFDNDMTVNVEVPLNDCLNYGDEYEHFVDLLRDLVAEATGAEQHRVLVREYQATAIWNQRLTFRVGYEIEDE